jgi:hypothetical protein
MNGVGNLRVVPLVLTVLGALSTPAHALEMGVPAETQRAVLVHQFKDEWCWAARLEAVVRFREGVPGPGVLRSELAAGHPMLLGLDVGYRRHAVVLAAGQCTIWPAGPKFYERSILSRPAH